MKNTRRIAICALAISLALSSTVLTACTPKADTSKTADGSKTEDQANTDKANTDKASEEDETAMVVNGIKVPMKEYQSALDYFKQQTESQTGAPIAEGSAEMTAVITQAKDAIIDLKVKEAKVTELGLDKMTEEEEKEIQDQYITQLSSFLEQYKTEATTELGTAAKPEDVDAFVEAKMDELFAQYDTSKDQFMKELRLQKGLEKLQKDTIKDVKVSDEEIKAYYDKRVTDQTTEFASNPDSFETSKNQGMAFAAPAGFCYVKHILIKLDEAATTSYATLKGELDSLGSEYTALLTSDETPEVRQQMDEKLKAIGEKKAELSKLYASIEPKAQEVLAKVNAGGDFDALVKEYGEDPGMQAEPAMTQGYLFGEKSQFVPEFLEAGKKLTKVGDTSGLVRSQFGIHIIRRVADIPAGPIPYDEVKADAERLALAEKQAKVYEEAVKIWITDAKIDDKIPTPTAEVKEEKAEETPAK